MRDDLRLYCRYVGISMRTQMQYRSSFILMSLAQLLSSGIEFLAVWALFDRFGSLRGWTLPEVALFYAVAHTALAIADATSRGFDEVGTLIKSGDFDRLLLRPRSTALQIAGQEITLRRVGRLVQALAVLIWAINALGLSWDLPRLTLLLATLFSCSCYFYGLFVLQGVLSFWTTETLELMATVTYGGVQTAQYPLSIYQPWLRRFFTVILPMGCVTYFPLLAILGRPDPLGTPVLFHWLSPLAGVGFVLMTLRFWQFGVRRYCSTGS